MREHVLAHIPGQFAFAEKDFPGIFLFQQLRLFLAMRAHDGLDARVDGPGDLDHPADVQSVRRGDDQHARALDMRLDQHHGLGGIAGYRRNPFLARRFDDLAIFLSEHERDPMRRELIADAPPNAAITDENDMAGESLQVDRHGQRRERIVGASRKVGRVSTWRESMLAEARWRERPAG